MTSVICGECFNMSVYHERGDSYPKEETEVHNERKAVSICDIPYHPTAQFCPLLTYGKEGEL